MTNTRPLVIAALLGLSGLGLTGPAIAQAADAEPKTQLTKQQVEDAAYEFHVMVSAMQSEKIEAPAKEKLFECMYGNAFGKIADAVDKVAAQNVGKLDKRNPDHVLGAMLSICGFKPTQATVTPAPAKPGAGR